MGAVRINQMGYSLNCAKQVVYVGEESTFSLYRSENNELIGQGSLSPFGLDKASGDYISIGDFSTLNKQGSYYIRVNEDVSPIFTVSDDQYIHCTDTLLKALYYQRCGVELSKQYAGDYAHTACHFKLAYLFGQDGETLTDQPEKLTRLECSGGWHDAGDYGRYTIATVKTIADLLLTYEHFSDVLKHPIGIPESNRPGADILHEVRIGLDFLHKLQRSDGAVYTKVATRYFPCMIMPEMDSDPLFVFDVSSPATAGFTAVMAMAAKSYEEIDTVFSKQCLGLAEKAYQWLKRNPEPLLFKNPPDIVSGEYGDNCDTDERYWAAAQMYRTTGDEMYHEDFLYYYHILSDRLSLGWKNVGGYGTIAYLFSERTVKQEIFDKLKEEWIYYAAELEVRSGKDGYGITLARYEYVWGSLMNLMNQSMHLIITDRLLKSSSFAPVVQNSWDYLYGKNPMDISYVTGQGERSVQHPHHRPSVADNIAAPVPGLVAGGPCAALADEITKEYCKDLPPAKCYIDHTESFSTNEVDIYWNSPAIYVGAYLCSKS